MRVRVRDRVRVRVRVRVRLPAELQNAAADPHLGKVGVRVRVEGEG